MHRVLRIVAVIAVLAVLPSGASAQGTGDYSSGQGIWQDESGDKSIGYEVVGNEASGDADGEFDLRSRTGDGFHADVICIRVEGNEAFLELDTNGDGDAEYEVYAVDNVAGNGGPRSGDTFGLKEEDDESNLGQLFQDEDCEEDRDNDQDNIRGDVFNIDGE